MAKKKIIIIGKGGGQNQDVAELQQQVQRLTAERNALQLQLGVAIGELEQANANVATLTSEKDALQQAVDELNEQITALNARIELLEETIENMGGEVPGEIIPGGPHNPENDSFEEDFLWIENVDDTDGTITLNLEQAPFMYYSYDDDTEFKKVVSSNTLPVPAHSKIYLRWKGKITTTNGSNNFPLISNISSNCNHNIGGELKNGGLKSYVYEHLFKGDTKLIDASQLKLSATALASSCYNYMFQGCTSLTAAPELPATTIAQYCYYQMFNGCTSLTTAPELPATTLANNCYQYMFTGCSSLTTVPELPATTLARYCYASMFSGCTSLTTAPELAATAVTASNYLSDYCYESMFSGCTSLNYVKINVVYWHTTYTRNWLKNVAPNGVVVVPPGSSIIEDSVNGIPSGWTKQFDPSAKNIINIHNISGLENTISVPNKFSNFKYKTNNDSEYNENPRVTALSITLRPDETLTIEGICNSTTSTTDSFTGITSTENINISGEVNYSSYSMFYSLFRNSTKLINAGGLKLSNSLDNYCYASMFTGCSSLTTAPELPATTLANNCYYYMFGNCTSLTTVPELPATTLAQSCYNSMFSGCTSLTTAPELPATTLTAYCYSNMFNDCSRLNSVTYLSTESFIYNDYQAKNRWLYNTSSTGTFRTPIENKEWLDDYPRGTSAVPSSWTIEYIE